MNFSHHLLFYERKLFPLLSKPLISFTCCQKYELSSYSKNKFEINYRTKLHNEKDNFKFGTFSQKVHVNGFRTLRRRPIGVITHDTQGKSFEEYINKSKAQAVEIISDETDIPRSTTDHHPFKDPPFSEGEQTLNKDSTFTKSKHHRKEISPSRNVPSDEMDTEEMGERKVLKNLNIQLYKHATGKIRTLFEYGKSPRMREKKNVFLVEGWRLLAEALASGLKPTAIFFSRSRLFINMIPMLASSEKELANLLNMFPLYKTPYSTFKTWSSLITPPGIMAAFPLSPAVELGATPKDTFFPVTVILDDVRDPSNLGSIIRTLAAAGVYKIVIMKGCCDLWDPKVLRSSCGAHFHLHCITKVPWSIVESHLPYSSSVFLADACRETASEIDDDDDDPRERVRLKSEKESKIDLKNFSSDESNDRTAYEVDEDGNKVIYNDSFNDSDHLRKFEGLSLPQFSYNELQFYDTRRKSDHFVVLIVGGETGLSNCAKKFAVENDGVRISIPMLNRIESLNSAVAVSILVYEMQRQFKNSLKEPKDRIENKGKHL